MSRRTLLILVLVLVLAVGLLVTDRLFDRKSGTPFQEVELKAGRALTLTSAETDRHRQASSERAGTTAETDRDRRCKRGKRVCKVLRRLERLAHRANRHHAVGSKLWPGDYTNPMRRTIKRKRLKMVTPRPVFRHPHRKINNDARVFRFDGSVVGQPDAGCKALVDERKVESLIFRTDLWTFETRFEWCWRNGRITYHSGHLETTQVDDGVVVLNGIIENNDRYVLGTRKRLFEFRRLYSASNCVFKYGCFKSWSPTYRVRVGVNGTWRGEFWWA